MAKKSWTITEIAKDCGVPRERICYVVRTRDIDHEQFVGNCRLYSDNAAKKIKAEIERIKLQTA